MAFLDPEVKKIILFKKQNSNSFSFHLRGSPLRAKAGLKQNRIKKR
jgi:hypothetical protein